MRTLLSDLRFAFRLMVRDRVFAIGTILTLMVCVGASAAIFAVVRSVLYRPLPYSQPDRLVFLYDAFPGAGVERAGTSVPNYYDRLEFKDVFESQALYRTRGQDVGAAGSAKRVRTMQVTPSFFHVFGRPPVRGRDFSDADGTPGQQRKAILDDGFARARFGSPPAAIGRTLTVNGESYEIVGVMPPGFAFIDPDVRIWIPFAFSPADRAEDRRYSQSQDEIARLAPGATAARAEQRLKAQTAANLERAGQLKPMLLATGYNSRVAPLTDDLVREVRRPLQLLWGASCSSCSSPPSTSPTSSSCAPAAVRENWRRATRSARAAAAWPASC
jgi:hypothetical protein